MKKFAFMMVVLFSVALIFSSFTPGHESVVGEWYNQPKDATLILFEKDGKVFGKINWMKEPNENGKPKVDKNNPDPAKRNTPAFGLVILKNFEKVKENYWENGTIYDPNNGKTYKSNLTLKDKNNLDVRGYIGFSLLGRTESWTRKE
jgi:uncharacterized protein (DUF2147 family)